MKEKPSSTLQQTTDHFSEPKPEKNPEIRLGVPFINGYSGNFGDDLVFNEKAIVGFCQRARLKGPIVLVPMASAIIDGPLNFAPHLLIQKLGENAIGIQINGRRILECQYKKGIQDPRELKSAFVRDFERVFRTALVKCSLIGNKNLPLSLKAYFFLAFDKTRFVSAKEE